MKLLLFYLFQKNLSLKQMYPPEVVVLVTPNVPPESYQSLCPTLCTRILPISEWIPPPSSSNTRTLDNHCPGWTKLRIFGLQQYDTILYIDSDCLVLQDVSSLLELNKVYTESQALIAAVPDLLLPHSFNSGVMVIRPSTAVMESMQQQAKCYKAIDGSDTGFLNAYFDTWNTEYPPFARLPVGYNAQQAMYDMTIEDTTGGRSTFWDHQISSDLYIVHYSNKKKPWECTKSGHFLETLWHTWYRKSKNHLVRIQKETNEQQQQQQQQSRMTSQVARSNAKAPPTGTHPTHAQSQQQQHKLITQRFKELRKQGKSRVEAMTQARAESGLGSDADEDAPSSKVAAMFGLL